MINTFLSKKTIRVNITMPEYKLIMIDKAAKDHGLSRSAFLMQAAERMAMHN
ncbi:HicB_like antitoxin of toxin-antitoxin system [Desulfocicer vacuolatum DSM 3385]|uniref:HicB_like antitoxin of toxin-antitoxin system n=1 Tax=Desulfocicer vacuolatum DSM 3385 TaxID=1121400 RepID=A0A1W2C3N7_9BACT|nr:type II toxin-antitoxin system HicB family antitoxin [Desulfocicer vacuolatum]SMC79783.1 HicB_like antitoxin of toxin-antitoxin system [Desulfocicer vacuolatum DSM 3385]